MKTTTTISFECELEVEGEIDNDMIDYAQPVRLGVICTNFKILGSKKYETKWLDPIHDESAEAFLQRIFELKEEVAIDAIYTQTAEDDACALDEHRERQEELRRWPD